MSIFYVRKVCLTLISHTLAILKKMLSPGLRPGFLYLFKIKYILKKNFILKNHYCSLIEICRNRVTENYIQSNSETLKMKRKKRANKKSNLVFVTKDKKKKKRCLTYVIRYWIDLELVIFVYFCCKSSRFLCVWYTKTLVSFEIQASKLHARLGSMPRDIAHAWTHWPITPNWRPPPLSFVTVCWSM